MVKVKGTSKHIRSLTSIVLLADALIFYFCIFCGNWSFNLKVVSINMFKENQQNGTYCGCFLVYAIT